MAEEIVKKEEEGEKRQNIDPADRHSAS